MAGEEHKDLNAPDEVREFPNGRAELINIGSGQVGRLVLQPGWRWSKDVKPLVGGEWCEAPHFQYHARGTLGIRMRDGTEFQLGPGSVSWLPSGHDGWVVGDEPVELIDWSGLGNYAKQ